MGQGRYRPGKSCWCPRRGAGVEGIHAGSGAWQCQNGWQGNVGRCCQMDFRLDTSHGDAHGVGDRWRDSAAGVVLLVARLRGGAPAVFAFAVKLFMPVLALVALANLWVGVTRAGYSVKQELPILVIVFRVPAAPARSPARRRT